MTDEHPDHPYGSLVEQIYRVFTTDQGVDAWVLAEEAVKVVTRRNAVTMALKAFLYEHPEVSVMDGRIVSGEDLYRTLFETIDTPESFDDWFSKASAAARRVTT